MKKVSANYDILLESSKWRKLPAEPQKPDAVISLTGLLSQGYTVVPDKRAAFGFFIMHKGKILEPDITLHEVDCTRLPFAVGTDIYLGEEDNGDINSGFDNIQGCVIKL